ncbi:MAG: DUF2188 domain-containing protein, partial [Chitinophagaceae bacterium]
SKSRKIKTHRAFHSAPEVIHVMTLLSNKWGVVLNGTRRAYRAFSIRRDAISFAKQMAISKLINEIVVHDNNGMVEKRIYLRQSPVTNYAI